MLPKLQDSFIGKFLRFCYRKIKAFWHWYKSLYKGSRWYKKTFVIIASLIAAFIIYLGMVDINFLWLFGKSPGFAQIKKPTTSEASEIYSADGVLIGKYFSENRTPVKYEDVNPVFWKAYINFFIRIGKYERARKLFKKSLEHVDVGFRTVESL